MCCSHRPRGHEQQHTPWAKQQQLKFSCGAADRFNFLPKTTGSDNMAMLPEYPVQLGERILEAPVDVARWNMPLSLSSAGIQLASLGTTSSAILTFLTFKYCQQPKARPQSRLGRSHIVLNLCGIITATACAVLTALSSWRKGYSDAVLAVLTSTLWVCNPLHFLLLRSHRLVYT